MFCEHTPVDEVLADTYAVPRVGPRLRHALHSENVVSLGQLLALTEWELFRIPNCGWHTIGLLKTALARHGFALAGEARPEPGLGVAFDY